MNLIDLATSVGANYVEGGNCYVENILDSTEPPTISFDPRQLEAFAAEIRKAYDLETLNYYLRRIPKGNGLCEAAPVNVNAWNKLRRTK